MDENKGIAFGLALLVHLVLLSSLVCMKLPAGNGNSSVIKVELSGGTRLASNSSSPAGGLHRGQSKAAVRAGFKPPERQSPAIAPAVAAASTEQPAVSPAVNRQLAVEPRPQVVLASTESIRHFHRRQSVPYLPPVHRMHPRPAVPPKKTPARAGLASQPLGDADIARTTVVSTAGAAGQASQSGPKAAATVNGTGPAAENGTGSGASSQAGIRSYLSAVRARIEAAKKYPPNALRRRIEGKVGVRFRLAADGRLLAVRVAAASGFRELDQAALVAVRRAAPFPGFPDRAKARPRSFKVSISFVVRDAS